MAGKTNYRVSMTMSIALMVLATIFDLFTLIPVVGDFLGPLFWIIVGVYFWIKGMGIFNGRKLAVTAISFVAELIPVVQELPALLAGIIAILFIMRIEDKTGISIVKPMSKGITPPRLQKNPFNGEPGVRQPRKQKINNSVQQQADFPLDSGEMSLS